MQFADGTPLEDRFRLTGTLRPQDIEALLDNDEQVGNINAAVQHFQSVSLLEEDFLDPTLKDLNALLLKVRGDNKGVLEAIIARVERLKAQTFSTMDEDADHMRKGLDCLYG